MLDDVLWSFSEVSLLIRFPFEDAHKGEVLNIIWTRLTVVYTFWYFFFISAPTNFSEFHLLQNLYSLYVSPWSLKTQERTRLKDFLFFFLCVSISFLVSLVLDDHLACEYFCSVLKSYHANLFWFMIANEHTRYLTK